MQLQSKGGEGQTVPGRKPLTPTQQRVQRICTHLKWINDDEEFDKISKTMEAMQMILVESLDEGSDAEWFKEAYCCLETAKQLFRPLDSARTVG